MIKQIDIEKLRFRNGLSDKDEAQYIYSPGGGLPVFKYDFAFRFRILERKLLADGTWERGKVLFTTKRFELTYI